VPKRKPVESDPHPSDAEEAELIVGVAGDFTENALSSARRLSLAGLAAIWLFHISQAVGFILPRGLAIPTLLFVLALGLEFLYWAVGALLWRMDFRFFKGAGSLKPWQLKLRALVLKVDDVDGAEVRTFTPTSVLFWGVLSTSLVGWLGLLIFLTNRVLFSGS
jgi:hypothetical protein